MDSRKKLITQAWESPELLKEDSDIIDAIISTVDDVDKGILRVAEKIDGSSDWIFHDWVRQAILLYFRVQSMRNIKSGDIEYYDKIDIKRNLDKLNIRVVPPAVARYGSFINEGAILMASYINIGAYIDSGTMIDINASIGSCAQIGKNVHISANAVIGGVLEPINASPVIIEDNVFIGATSSIVEGVHIMEGAVIGSGVNITKSTKIIDVTGDSPIEIKGHVPPFSIVIPGSIPKKFACGEYNISCAMIIGKRNKNTDSKVALNELLR